MIQSNYSGNKTTQNWIARREGNYPNGIGTYSVSEFGVAKITNTIHTGGGSVLRVVKNGFSKGVQMFVINFAY